MPMPKTVGYDTQTLIKILSDLDIDLMDIDSDAGMIDALKEGAAKLQVGGNTTDERYVISFNTMHFGVSGHNKEWKQSS